MVTIEYIENRSDYGMQIVSSLHQIDGICNVIATTVSECLYQYFFGGMLFIYVIPVVQCSQSYMGNIPACFLNVVQNFVPYS